MFSSNYFLRTIFPDYFVFNGSYKLLWLSVSKEIFDCNAKVLVFSFLFQFCSASFQFIFSNFHIFECFLFECEKTIPKPNWITKSVHFLLRVIFVRAIEIWQCGSVKQLAALLCSNA